MRARVPLHTRGARAAAGRQAAHNDDDDDDDDDVRKVAAGLTTTVHGRAAGGPTEHSGELPHMQRGGESP